jgi:hypothetical protein
VTGADVPEISPEEASRSGAGQIRDEELPMLAAVWLAQGYDSDELRGLAGLTRQEARQTGRRLLPDVLASLGWPPRDHRPRLDYWHQIEFAQAEMDRLLAPYAAAQRVIEVAGDVPDLWAPVGAERLISLLKDWDDHPAERQRTDDQIREHLRSLREEDLPRW